MNGEEFGYLNMLNLKNKMERPNNSDFVQNWFPQEIRYLLFNLWKFIDCEICTPESSRIH